MTPSSASSSSKQSGPAQGVSADLGEASLHTWASRIESLIETGSISLIGRVYVLASTASTQDAARQFAGESASTRGLCVLTGEQTAGRGRLGRSWSDSRGLGLAMTLAIDAGRFTPGTLETLPLAIGLAACRSCEQALGRKHVLGVRWPNDVVERARSGRKVAGVLIERATLAPGNDILLIGIGINVAQSRSDFPTELRDHAVSLRSLADSDQSTPDRLDVACLLLHEIERSLALGASDLSRAWKKRDVLVGTRRTFIHNGRPVSGVVEGIDPISRILVRTNLGNVVSLPALSTSMVHEDGVRMREAQ